MVKNFPLLSEEKKLWKKNFNFVIGLDEAGRGPLAGPVVAGAVAIKKGIKIKIKGLRDSKKLSPKEREKIFLFIKRHPYLLWASGTVSEKIIDKINIFQATKLAMKRAVKNLERKNLKKRLFSQKMADALILDGKFAIDLPIFQKTVVRGDEKVFSCALASIVAKVIRDRIMFKYHQKYPQYRFDLHKGYPTTLHLKKLQKNGLSPIHRKSFWPCRLFFSQKFEC